MAEDQTPQAGEAPLSESQPQGIRILAQFMRDASFENPKAPDSLSGDVSTLKIDRQIEINIRGREDGLFEVDLKLTAGASRDQEAVFYAEVLYGGLFAIDGVPPEEMEAVLAVDCPRYLFPFARRTIADMTAEGGFPPLRVDPIDFGGIYLARRAEAERLAAEAGAGNA